MPDFYIGDYVYFQDPNSRKKGYGRVVAIDENPANLMGWFITVRIGNMIGQTCRVAAKHCKKAPFPNSPSITPYNAPRMEISLVL